MSITMVLALAALAFELVTWNGHTQLRWGGSVSPAVVILAAVLAYGFLGLLWRAPLFAYGVVWAFSLVTLALPRYTAFGGLLIAVYVVARLESERVSRFVLALTALPFGLLTVSITSLSGPPSARDVLVVGSVWTAVVLSCWLAGRTGHRHDARAQTVAAELEAAEEQARAAERARIARELHDIVAHSVSAIVLQAAGARALVRRSGEGAREGTGEGTGELVESTLGTIEDTGVQAMRELHRMLGLLRADGPTVGEPRRLVDIRRLVETTRASGLDVEQVETGVRTCVDSSVELAAYRLVQESLANAMKHGGAGTAARVSLTWQDGLEVSVVTVATATAASAPPSSRATPLASGGHGLAGLRERVMLVGGTFDAYATPTGFVTTARLPVGTEIPRGRR